MQMQHPSPSASTDTSRVETETEDEPERDAESDGDISMNYVPRSRIANRSTSTATPRHINAALNAGQRPQLDSPAYPHNHVLRGSTPVSASISASPERTAPSGMRNATRGRDL